MTTTRCPHCGQSVTLTKANTLSTGWHAVTRLESAVPAIAQTQSAPMPQFAEAERRAPARAASLESDVAVPATQALITGAVSLIPGIALTIWFEMPWYSPFLIAGGVIALFWLYLLDAHRKLLWSIERITNTDIDGDGATGKPEPARTVRVEVQHGRTTEIDDLPGPADALADFAAGVLNRRYSFSERGAARAGYGATAFKQLRNIFVARGWAQWRNPDAPRQGIDLRRKGAAILEQLAKKEQINV